MSTYVRWDLLERGWTQAVTDATGVTAIWDYGNADYSDLQPQWVASRVFSGPQFEHRPMGQGRTIPNVTSATLQITASTAGRYGISVNGHGAWLNVAGTETITEIRDALLALLVVSCGEENTPTASSTDSILIAQSGAGSLRRIELTGPISLSASTTSGAVKVSEGSMLVSLEVQAFSAEARSPSASAVPIQARIASMWRNAAILRNLAEYGVKPREMGTAQDLTDIPGANWESRISRIVGISIPGAEAVEVTTITDLSLDLVVRNVAGATVETLQITATA